MTDAHENAGFPGEIKGQTPMPKGKDLFQSFKAVAHAWLGQSCQSLGQPVEGPSVMPFERCAYLAGSIRGLVDIRADSCLGGVLLEKCGGWDRTIQTSDEAFREFFRIFCGHLLSSFWKMDGTQAVPSRSSTPQSWPKGKPQASVALLLDQCPVEIRFWVETGTAP